MVHLKRLQYPLDAEVGIFPCSSQIAQYCGETWKFLPFADEVLFVNAIDLNESHMTGDLKHVSIDFPNVGVSTLADGCASFFSQSFPG